MSGGHVVSSLGNVIDIALSESLVDASFISETFCLLCHFSH